MEVAAASSLDHDARSKELIMGSSDSQMNLANLQTRIVDLQKQLEKLRLKLQANPAGMSFKSVLTELGVVNACFAQLHKEIRPHLQFYVAHPQHLGQDDVVMVPEQLSSMPLLEMTEEQEDLLKHLPDAQHQPLAREAAIMALSVVPAKHNTAINSLFVAGQTLHEKGPLRKRILSNRTVINKEVTLKIRQAHSEQMPLGAGKLPQGLDHAASEVFSALKKGTV